MKANKENTYTVVMVRPSKLAVSCEIGTELKDLQAAVGGCIQVLYPDPDESICYICNEESKNLNMKPNRALYDEDGEIYDIISGSFFICRIDGESFASLTPEQVKYFRKKHLRPEVFARVNGKLVAIPYAPAILDIGEGGTGNG